jgi:hypothetical protein
MEILKTGMAARFDTFAGLIPCRVRAIRVDRDGDKLATIDITRDRGAYRRGEMLEVHARYVIPVKSVFTRCGQYRIRAYEIEIDRSN